jgi:PIN domain nuclease of toxin-antitoxin system
VSYLIDTNVLIWLLAGSARLPQQTIDTLADPQNIVYVSVVSTWEMAIKVAIGRLNLPPDLDRWLPPALDAAKLAVLPIEVDHTLGVEHLPFHHADPFDRLLIVQAQQGGHTLVSSDRIFDRYDVSLLRC